MINTTTNLFDTIQSHIKDFEGDLNTGMPAIVEAYDPKECTVDVYPAIYKKNNVDGLLSKELLLERVPVVFSATKDFGITFPVAKGDKVWLMFSQRDSENWLVSSEEYTKPKTNRKHDINDAFALVGGNKYNESAVPEGEEENFCLRYKGTKLSITPDGELIVDTATTITINASGQDINIDAANLNVTGDISDGVSSLSSLREAHNTHTHIGYAGTQTTPPDITDP